MARYDATVKSLIWHGAPALLRQIAGAAVVQIEATEYPQVRARRPDFVARLDNGEVLHLELQADPDPSMAWRMLEYFGLIAQHHGGLALRQCVLALSDDAMVRMPDGLSFPHLTYRYPVMSIEGLDADPLLDSAQPDDTVLAILCRSTDIYRRVRRILDRLRELDDAARNDAVVKLLILSDLRGMVPRVVEEVRAMAIQLDIERNTFLKGVFDQGVVEGEARGKTLGRAEGLAHAVLSALRRRFGPPAEAVIAEIRDTPPEELEGLLDRALTAETLDAVFGGTRRH